MTSKRIKTIAVIFILFFVVLVNFFYLQIIQYDMFSDRAISKVVRKIPVDAQRGLIVDRMGRHIVRNKNVYDLQVLPIDVQENFDYDFLGNYIGFDSIQINALREKVKKSQKSYSRKFRPISIINKISEITAFKFKERNSQFPGLIIRDVSTRQYERGSNINMAHILGQTVINRESYANPIFDKITLVPKYKGGGVENSYDSILSGESGERLYLFDARGVSRGLYEGKVYKPKTVMPGEDVQLTIDVELQKYIYDILGDSIPASVICMIPSSGEILAYVNKPSIDLSHFNLGVTQKYLDSLNASNSNSPYINRSIRKYVPGSIMKIPVAIMLLEEGVNQNIASKCDGAYEFGYPDTIRVVSDSLVVDSIFYPSSNIKKCWLESGHGDVNLNHAIFGSCNYYFYDSVINNYTKVYRNNWKSWMKKLGFGDVTGVDIELESKASIDGKVNSKSNLLNLVIGQNIEVTPIQVAQMINIVANGGKIVTPHFYKNSDNVRIEDLGLKSSTLNYIKKSMKDAVYKNSQSLDLSIRGTAWRSLYEPGSIIPWTDQETDLRDIKIYAKTGTAETGKDYRKELIDKKGIKYSNPKYLDYKIPNAWYAGYIEYNNSQVSIVVMLENGGKGGKLSADIARMVFKKIINLNKIHGYY